MQGDYAGSAKKFNDATEFVKKREEVLGLMPAGSSPLSMCCCGQILPHSEPSIPSH
jgi:hypothetical protein